MAICRIASCHKQKEEEEHGEIVQPNEAWPNSIIVFDDVACVKQDNIRAFFSMGRHRLIECFYLSQTYARIPKDLIRFLVFDKDNEINQERYRKCFDCFINLRN